ncbi:MAG TPA: hypothetical protein VEJ41_00265 [Candidatus Acidoferrales bacterium]|nr:hypothetical protein [Candidatus Acidoferrales bacterium]
MRTVTIIGVLTLALALAACSTRHTIVTSSGTTTVETNAMHDTVKLTSGHGTAIIGRGAVDAAALGLPIYPGALPNATGGMAVQNSSGSSSQVSLQTDDNFDHVYQWYRQRMPNGSEQTHLVVKGGSVASFELGALSDRDQKSVVITESGGKTTILLTHVIKSD